MELYLSAPHGAYCKDSMDVYLATPNSGYSKMSMDVYLSSPHSNNTKAALDADTPKQKIYVLESFYYICDWMLPYIKNHWHFMLDSGAFTFMSNADKTVDWDEYLERYAQFIVENDIQLFFELDIDSVVGLKRVEQLRKRLHDLTKRSCIPVWHRARGLQYWIDMCKHYDYVAIGGIVSKEIKRNEFPIFHKLLNIAKENDCKVHGLGFTNTEGLKKYKFYSVDSTAWIYGNMSGCIYKFDGTQIIKITRPEGTRLNGKPAAIHNFREWVKFQQYAKTNL